MSNDNNGLLHAFILDGQGKGRQIGWKELTDWKKEDGVLWLHLDYSNSRVQAWIRDESGLDEIVTSALLSEETRPRCDAVNDGVLISLRGINHDPSSDVEDMVALRLYADSSRVISTRQRTVLSANDLCNRLLKGEGPVDSGDLIVTLAERLISRMSDVISDIEESVDSLEEKLLENTEITLRGELLVLRRKTILIRRYLGPQREALHRLYSERLEWLYSDCRLKLRESIDRLTRYVEELDSARDRTAVAYEELSGRLADQLNSRMYLLSIIAGIFLPLGFFTGLLGINVGGIPWANSQWGFVIVVGLLILISLGEYLYFKRRKWL